MESILANANSLVFIIYDNEHHVYKAIALKGTLFN